MSAIKSIFKFSCFLFLCLALIPPQVILLLFHRGPKAQILPWVFQWLSARIYGLTAHLDGTPVRGCPVMYVGNHISYLDIIAIGQHIPVSFVAKKEVAGWPLFGWLAKLQRSAFIDRARTKAAESTDNLTARLIAGDAMLIFGEGTSTNGNTVLPYKSTLFDIFFKDSLSPETVLQPFTLSVLSVDGRRIQTDADRDLYAWHGDMTLIPHLWQFGKLKGAELRLTFHPPRRLGDYTDRKALAVDCHKDTLAGLYLPENEQPLAFAPEAA